MTEGTHIPGSPACAEWEAQLTDALDGLLSPEEEARFEAHKLHCPACTELYEEARKGREWLEFLSPEPEPPEWLLAKILASTGPGHEVSALPAGVGPDAVPAFVPPVCHPTDEDLSVGTPVWQQVGFVARMRTSAAPRMAMTAAMAFFSIALTLNLTGVGLNSLRMADLRPSALRSYMERQLSMASVPIVRYYDHLRIVHVVESRVRELQSQNPDDGNGDVRQQKPTQPATPGESRKIREQGNERTRDQESKKASRPDQEQTAPAESYGSSGGANGKFVETALTFPIGTKHTSGHSGGSMVQGLERSSPWIA
jgi:hypothetical protein